MEIVEVPVINTVDAMYVEKFTANKFFVSKLNGYLQAVSFLAIEQSEDLDISLRDTDLS